MLSTYNTGSKAFIILVYDYGLTWCDSSLFFRKIHYDLFICILWNCGWLRFLPVSDFCCHFCWQWYRLSYPMPSCCRDFLSEQRFIFFFSYGYGVVFYIGGYNIGLEGEFEPMSLSYGKEIRSIVFSDDLSWYIYDISFFFRQFLQEEFLNGNISDKT